MSAVADIAHVHQWAPDVTCHCPATRLLTFPEINEAIRAGRLTSVSAGYAAADRRYLGLCDECPNPMDRDPESKQHLCRACNTVEHQCECDAHVNGCPNTVTCAEPDACERRPAYKRHVCDECAALITAGTAPVSEAHR